MRCVNNTDKNVTVRKQKIRKNHVREKLIFFTILALILLLAAAFARKLCPYDPDVQDLLMAQKPPSAEHILGTDRYGRLDYRRIKMLSAQLLLYIGSIPPCFRYA